VPRPGKIPVLFLDANVLFSAAYSPEGRSAALYALARRRRCGLVSSHYAVEEARRNLSDKKPEGLKVFSAQLNWVKMVPEGDLNRQTEIRSLGLDLLDVPILAAAIGRAERLVTGDRTHFGRWMGKAIQGVQISSLADALDWILKAAH
jgi:predicted nucleic acid-binding protein